MRAMGAWARAAAVGLGTVLGGCLGADAFLCESDVGCQRAGTQGLCQPSGYCSFPDAACPSGQRYGQHASDPLANTCVELGPLTDDGSTSDEVATTSPLTTSSTTSVTSSTTSPPTTGVDGPVTTEPVGEPDTGGSTGPSTTDVGEEAPATTEPPAEVVCWGDDFEDGAIGPEWCVWLDQGITADEPRGHLRFSLSPNEWGMGSRIGSAATCEWVPLLGAEAVTEVLAVPQVSPFTEAFIELGNDDLRLGVGVLGGELYAFLFDGMGYAGVGHQPYDPAAHRFLRVMGTGAGLVAESSPDGATWDPVHTMEADLAAVEGYAAIGAWGEMTPLGPDEATFAQFELCWLQG